MKKKYQYPAIFEKGGNKNDAGYGVRFPDLPKGVSAGNDLTDARSMARELLELILRDYAENSEEFPTPGSVKETCSNMEHLEIIEIEADLGE